MEAFGQVLLCPMVLLPIVGAKKQINRPTVCVGSAFIIEVSKQFDKTILQRLQIDRIRAEIVIDTVQEWP